MRLDRYRSKCHGELVRPFLFTEKNPPKGQAPSKVIICQCLFCNRLCSIKKEGQ